MRKYDQVRTSERKQKRVLKQHTVIPKAQMKMPEKNVPVFIRKGLTVFTDSVDKIDAVKKKYEGR